MYAIILSLAIGAPAPVYKEPPGLQIVPGHYTMTWAVTMYPIIYQVELKDDGTLVAKSFGGHWISYIGSWSYNPKTRKLTFQERYPSTGQISINWEVILDARLVGVGEAVWSCDQSKRDLKVTLRKSK